MSATNRGAKRAEHDFYETPSWLADALFCAIRGDGFKPKALYEPGFGRGALGAAARRAFGKDTLVYGVDVRGVSVQETDYEVVIDELTHPTRFERVDFLTAEPYDEHRRCGLIAMNPPFSLAREFINRALEINTRACVAALLRLNLLGPVKRAASWRSLPLSGAWVTPTRPSLPRQGSDATEYAWFMFRYPRPGLRILHTETKGAWNHATGIVVQPFHDDFFVSR